MVTIATDAEAAAILACPFCGSENIRVDTILDGAHMTCISCFAFGPPRFNPDGRAKCLPAWNRRATGRASVVEREALQELVAAIEMKYSERGRERFNAALASAHSVLAEAVTDTEPPRYSSHAREAVTDAPNPLKCPGDGCPGCIHCRASSYPPTVTDALQVQPQTSSLHSGSASSDEAARTVTPVAVRIEYRAGDYCLMQWKYWQPGRKHDAGARVHALYLGEEIQAGYLDEEVLLLFPSIVEAQLNSGGRDVDIKRNNGMQIAASASIPAAPDSDEVGRMVERLRSPIAPLAYGDLRTMTEAAALLLRERERADKAETLLRHFAEEFEVLDLSDETFDMIAKRAHDLWDIEARADALARELESALEDSVRLNWVELTILDGSHATVWNDIVYACQRAYEGFGRGPALRSIIDGSRQQASDPDAARVINAARAAEEPPK